MGCTGEAWAGVAVKNGGSSGRWSVHKGKSILRSMACLV